MVLEIVVVEQQLVHLVLQYNPTPPSNLKTTLPDSIDNEATLFNPLTIPYNRLPPHVQEHSQYGPGYLHKIMTKINYQLLYQR